MSRTIDEKVVEMRFENSQFEKGIAESISSLNSLKENLNFNSTIDTSNISGSLQSIGASVDNISEKFTTFGILAHTAIVKVAESIVDMGMKWKDNLLKGATEGFGKYEKMMESIQTIMYGTRQEWDDTEAQMDYVTGQIQKLNWFTDETSYNLTDMTSNIGKFVSVGIKLDDAASSMMGIANWAAISGANAEQASRAMYNLSQAMGIGALTVADWKSIENANMATKEFKEAAINAGVAQGVLKEAYNKNGTRLVWMEKKTSKGIKKEWVGLDNFRNTLSEKWLNKDVMTTVLKRYGDFSEGLYNVVEETGLTATELLDHIEEYKEAVANGEDMDKWVSDLADRENVSNVIALSNGLANLSTEYMELGRQAFMAGQECKTFKDVTLAVADAVGSAWMGIFTAIFGNYQESKELWTAVAEEMYEIMVEPINRVRRSFETWAALGGRNNLVEGLWNVWYSIKAVMEAFQESFDKFLPKQSIYYWLNITHDFLAFTEDLKNIIAETGYESGKLHIVTDNIAKAFATIMDSFSRIGRAISYAWKQIFPSQGTKEFSDLRIGIRSVLEVLEKLTDAFAKFVEKNAITKDRMDKLTRSFAGLFAVLDILKLLVIAIIKPFKDVRTETGNMVDPILDVTASIGDWLVALRDWIKENEIFDKAVSTVIAFLKQIPVYADKATMAMFGMHLDEVWNLVGQAVLYAGAVIFDFFMHLPEYANEATMALFGTDLAGFWELLKQWVIDTWNATIEFCRDLPDKINALSDFLFGCDFQTWWSNTKDWANQAKQGVVGFFIDVKEKAEQAWIKLQEFIESIPGKMDELAQTLFHKSWQELWTDISTGFTEGIEKIKAAIHEIAKFFGLEDWNEPGGKHNADTPFKQWIDNLDLLQAFGDAWGDFINSDGGKALRNVAGTIAVLAALYLIVNGVQKVIGLVKQLKSFRSPLDNVGPMGAINNIVDGFTEIQSKAAKLVNFAAFKMIGDMILEIAGAVAIIAALKPDALNRGVLTLTYFIVGTMGIFNLVGNSDTEKMKQIGIAFAIMGGVFLQIGLAMALLQNMDLAQIAVAAASLGGVLFAIFGVFGLLDKMVIRPDWMAQWARSFVLMGVAILGIGAAMSMMEGLDPVQIRAAAIAISAIILAIAGAAILLSKFSVAEAAIASIAVVLVALGAGAALAALSFKIIVDAIKELSEIGSEGVDNIIYGIHSFFDEIPHMAQKAGEAIISFLNVMVDNKETIWETVKMIVTGILVAIAAGVPIIVDILADLFVQLLDKGNETLPKLVEFLTNLLDAILWIILDATPKITNCVFQLIQDTLDQLLDNIEPIVKKVTQISIRLITGFIKGITDEIPNIVETGWQFVLALINGIAEGIEKHAEELRAALVRLKDAIVEGLLIVLGIAENKEDAKEMRKLGEQTIQGFINGLGEKFSEAKDKMTEIANGVIDTFKRIFKIHSPSDLFKDFGIDTVLGWINGIQEKIAKAKEEITTLAKAIIDKFKEKLSIKTNGASDEFFKMAGNVITGFVNGITSTAKKAYDTVTNWAKNIIDKVKKKFDEHSPSKVFEEIGIFVDEGFINGVVKYIPKVDNAIDSLGDSAIETLSSTVASISDMMMSNLEDPTIKPTLDLTDVATGMSVLDGLFNADRSVSLAADSGTGVNNKIVAQNRQISAIEELQASLSNLPENQNGVTQNNVFNISGSDPREIADEVSNILQKQIDRRNAAWAL